MGHWVLEADLLLPPQLPWVEVTFLGLSCHLHKRESICPLGLL